MFLFDFVSFGFFSCVSFISGVVLFYSLFYMEGAVDMRRFVFLVFLFVFSMFLLVFSGNFFLTMVGWDGLGLVSFLLVVFYPNSSSLDSGLITVFSNRVGDVFFLVSFLFFYSVGSSSFDSFSFDFLPFLLLFIFFGGITKSAQIPFSAWLPAAIAAPTPVSSLVHSSTLVTAGVYVFVRFNYIFSYFDFFFLSFLFLSTIVLSGLCAILEKDFKKIVAISTLRQLGMIMFVLSIGLWVLSFIHMIIHAFFKSMLFLRTGSIISQARGLQESRFYGGFVFSFSSFVYFVVSCLCLSGFPFFIGFYSKDFIISSFSFFGGVFFYYFFILGCLFTVAYRARLIYEGFFLAFGGFCFLSLKETSYFFLPVLFLFFNCWVLGGAFYWVFLSDFIFSFFLFDLFFGILLLLFGIITFLYIKIFYRFFFFLSNVLFLRWGFNGGASSFNSKFFFSSFESSWIEVLGGSGIYSLFIRSNFLFTKLDNIAFGSMAFVSLVAFFYFFFLYLLSYFQRWLWRSWKFFGLTLLFLNFERVKFSI
jgi:NADH-ubiquinone oxidoreductase chain 5